MWDQVTETLNQTFLGNSLWQWLGFLLVLVASFIVRTVVRFFVDRWLKKLAERTATEADDRILQAFRRPAFFLVYIVGFYLALEVLTLPIEPINLPRFITALFTSALWAISVSAWAAGPLASSVKRKAEAKKLSIVNEHEVKQGEVLGAIAISHGIRLEDLMEANKISDPDKVNAGQKLKIPGDPKNGALTKRGVVLNVPMPTFCIHR